MNKYSSEITKLIEKEELEKQYYSKIDKRLLELGIDLNTEKYNLLLNQYDVYLEYPEEEDILNKHLKGHLTDKKGTVIDRFYMDFKIPLNESNIFTEVYFDNIEIINFIKRAITIAIFGNKLIEEESYTFMRINSIRDTE